MLWSAANDCLLYTSDAADEEDSVDLGGRRIIKKKTCNLFSILRQTTHKNDNLGRDFVIFCKNLKLNRFHFLHFFSKAVFRVL